MPPAEREAAAPRYRDVRFCPRCGQAYRPEDFHPDEVLFLCPACGFDFYQNPLPSAVVAIAHPERPDAVLVLKRRTPPGIGLWCLPGGFIRYGEPPEEAAAREAREETGLDADIGPVLRVGMLDYAYRGRRVCVLEVVYHARLRERPAAALRPTAESSETAFLPIGELLAAPDSLAFPEHLAVLHAFAAATLR